MAEPGNNRRWRRTMGLAVAVLVAGGALVDLIAIMGEREAIRTDGFPLGYVLTLIIAPLLASALVFWFAGRQAAIDRPDGPGSA